MKRWGAVVPVRLGTPARESALRTVLDALLEARPDELWVVEQVPEDAAIGPALVDDEIVRHERVVLRREAFERSRLVNSVLPRMTTHWVLICDAAVVAPFDEIGRRLRSTEAVAAQAVADLDGRPAPLGKSVYAVERDVLLAVGGLSEAFVGHADEGFELVRRLKKRFSDFATFPFSGTHLRAPPAEVDRSARADNKVLKERLVEAIELDFDRYLAERFESSLPIDRQRLDELSRDRARRAAFRATCPTPPPRRPRRLPGSIWGVTTLFNPAGYVSKVDNFHLFREGLRAAGLPLLAVELAFGDAPFALGTTDADRVVQLRASDVLWQKERLLNLGVSSLPDACDKVVWLDADVLFEERDWVARTAALLEEVVVLQPFSRSIRLMPGERSAPVERFSVGSGEHEVLHSMAWGVAAKGPGCLGRYLEHGHCGYAWAARRDLLEKHGLYDANILGNGDLNTAHAMFGGARTLKTDRLSDKARAHVSRWADAFYADVGGSVGWVDGTVHHLWHGKKADRRYVDRLTALIEHDYDPDADIALDESGCYRWASHKPVLHGICRDYFQERREDAAS